MSKYYYLIAGLPNIALDDSKLAYSVGDFREEVEPMLSAGDKKLVDLFYLKYDNANAVAFVEGSDNLADEWFSGLYICEEPILIQMFREW